MQCPGEDTCALRNRLHTEMVLCSYQPNTSELTCTPEMVSGSWTSFSSTFISGGIALFSGHDALHGCAHCRALVWTRRLSSCVSILSHAWAEPPPMTWMGLLLGATRRCTTITKGNSTQKTSTEPAWCKTPQHDLFLQSPSCCAAPPPS